MPSTDISVILKWLFYGSVKGNGAAETCFGEKLFFLKYISLALILTVSVLHLFMHKHGNLTKALLLPSIALYYFLSAPSPSPIFLLALAASWLGDILLMRQGIKWFTSGGISFMLSHLMFMLFYARSIDFHSLKLCILIPAAIIYCTAAALIIKSIKPTAPQKMSVPLYLYLFMNASMNVFALMQLMSLKSFGAAIAYLGAILFFISDCSLFMQQFYKRDFKNSFLLVMFTYIAGEFLIAQGATMI